jgi:hypothetical protein
MISSFVKFMTTKKREKTKTFSPSSILLLGPGSEIRDPGLENFRIRDKHPRSATLGKKTFQDNSSSKKPVTGPLFKRSGPNQFQRIGSVYTGT